jgi:hypothetical protein
MDKIKGKIRRRLLGEERIQVSWLHPGRAAADATG